jgi:hypothetical protein
VSTTSPAWLPSTSTARCPVCGAVYDTAPPGRCPGCRIDLTHPAVPRLRDLNDHIRTLHTERDVLVAALEETRLPVPAAAVTPAGTPPPPPGAPIWAQAGRPGAPPTPSRRQPRAPIGVPTLLALAGGALLTAAAVVFVAVTWETLPSWAQAAILLGATVLAGTIAVVLERRVLPAAAAAVGLVTMAFAAVDVVAIDRGGLLALDAYTLALAAGVAAVVGWLLERRGVRWTARVGAAAVIVAANAAAAATPLMLHGPTWTIPLLLTGAALVVAATALAWRDGVARAIVLVGGAVEVFACGALAALIVGADAPPTPLLPGVLIVGLPIVVFLVAARWSDRALAPATLLLVGGTLGFGYRLLDATTWPWLPTVAAATVTVALTWTAARLPPQRALPVTYGTAVPAAVLAGITLYAAGSVLLRLGGVAAPALLEWQPAIDPWLAVLAALATVMLLASPAARRHLPWMVTWLLAISAGALPVEVAWPLLVVGAVLTGALATTLAPALQARTARVHGLRVDPLAALTLAVLGTGWAAGRSVTLLVAAAVTTAVAGWLVLHADQARCRVAIAVGLPAAALAVAMAVDAAGGGLDVRLGAALLTVMVGGVVLHHLAVEEPPVTILTVAGAATVVLPPFASSDRAMGVLLLVAAAGWLALALSGSVLARWAGAVVGSAGIGLLLQAAGVEVTEAYVAAPTVLLGAAGVWSLVEDRDLPTMPALVPALVVGLVPSLYLLNQDPQHLARTLGLAVAAGLLALAGVWLRWRAPTVAGALTAILVALIQLWEVASTLPRWITFAVVGILLVWLAATYERQQQRARALFRRIDALR